MSQMKGLTHLIFRASFHVTVLLFMVFDLSTASKSSLLGSSWTLPLQQPIRGLLQDNEKSEVSHWYPAWEAEGDNHHKGDPYPLSPVETKHGQGRNTKKTAYKIPHNGMLHIVPPSIPAASPSTQIFKCHAKFIYGAFVYNQANDPTAALDVYVSNTGSMDLGYNWSFVMYNAHYTEYTSCWNLKVWDKENVI
ncbi:hypothetical protein CEUSTIGMA_g9661.t1 [Chlamydomonas eustigma]|uniref:Neprosin domain-containing protein n=1 Tax=Chlamydomonas eustigma TaxID=1157962 RepID=A0A250XGQ3_9CHLO|nr:hypothetical protein CEUSTIGMA_g9661.t1 [Chlamydomonas eustigma]|eukprot:GAX82233.1 hypothetical protein CEUSTIGMA_g9661.t1 [Chlamydomonas eustigma]